MLYMLYIIIVNKLIMNIIYSEVRDIVFNVKCCLFYRDKL